MARFEISPNIGNISKTVDALVDYANGLDERITEVAANIPSKMIVEELPEEGDPNITYYVGPKGTEPNLYYEVWVWVQEVEDGPFVWRELEDTDQVDLSGYLPIQTGTTVLPQVYVKNADGTQGMFNVGGSPTTGNIPIYQTDGKMNVGTPTSSGQAANKGYVDNGFVAKSTSTTTNPQVYVKNADGTQTLIDIVQGSGAASTIPQRTSSGQIKVGVDPTEWNDVVIKHFADEKLVAKVNTVTTYRQVYAKNPDGTQYMQVVNGKDFDAGVDRIACYGTDGRLRVGTPVNDKDAATKGYVDATVGQLIYKHQITLGFTVNSRSFTLDIVMLNGTSTAYTSTDGRQMLTAIKSSAYSITTSIWADNKFWSVAVTASDKYIHDDTGIGFLLTAPADGTTIYVDGIDPSYNSDITGVTISDVVTTW